MTFFVGGLVEIGEKKIFGCSYTNHNCGIELSKLEPCI